MTFSDSAPYAAFSLGVIIPRMVRLDPPWKYTVIVHTYTVRKSALIELDKSGRPRTDRFGFNDLQEAKESLEQKLHDSILRDGFMIVE